MRRTQGSERNEEGLDGDKDTFEKNKTKQNKNLSDTTGTFYPLKSSELMILCLNEHFSHFSVKAWTTSRDEEDACFTFKFERGADNSGINAGIKVPVCARLSCKHVCSL